MRLSRTLAAVGALAAAALTLSACAPAAPEAKPVEAGDATLTIATTSDVVNFNPLIGNSRTDYWVTNLMYPHLLSIAEDGSKEPQLAVEWGNTDPTSGFYEIRDDMSWSDGTKLTAEDVAWTFNAVKQDAPSGTFYGQMESFESAKAVSDTRVEITLNRPDSSVIEELGFWGNVVPKHVFEQAETVAEFPNDAGEDGWVSAGPYRLTKMQVGQSYTMERVADYPLVEGGTPVAAKLVYRVFPDVNTEILALQSGEVDLIANALPPAQVEQLRNTKGITVQEVPGLGYAHMTYNMQQEDLAKLEVRQALAHAVDYEAIRTVVLQGQAVSTGSSPLFPALQAYHDPLHHGVRVRRREVPLADGEGGLRRRRQGHVPGEVPSDLLAAGLGHEPVGDDGQGQRRRGRHHDRAAGHGAQHLPGADGGRRLRHLRRQLRHHGRPADEHGADLHAGRGDQLHLRR